MLVHVAVGVNIDPSSAEPLPLRDLLCHHGGVRPSLKGQAWREG